jgi:AraC-like DNA-binding protein
MIGYSGSMSDAVLPSTYQVSISVLAQLARYLSHLNIDIEKIFDSVGVDPRILDLPDRRIDVEKYIAIEDKAAEVTDDPYFGLHMGEFAEPGSWSIIGYMMMNSRTLGEAFELSGRYAKIIGNMISGKVQYRKNKITVILGLPENAPVHSRHCYESTFSSTMRISRRLSGKSINPLEVGFNYPLPAAVTEYKRIFQCPVLFNQKYSYMVLDRGIVSIPVVSPNPGLLQQFETYAGTFLKEIEETGSLSGRIKKIILSNLSLKDHSIGIAAEELGMSIRSLQNYLKKEGMSFRDILQETRKQLAKKCLVENYTIEDISFILGFSESSVFQNAFKKWTGLTPGEYRKSISGTNKYETDDLRAIGR